MTKECVWYNGETSSYELLDFDPNGLTKEEIVKKAKEILYEKYGFNKDDLNKVSETLYLIDVDNLENLNN